MKPQENGRILIVDDDYEILEILGMYLRSKSEIGQKYRIESVETGKEAIDRIKEGNIIAMITDYNLSSSSVNGLHIIETALDYKVPQKGITMFSASTDTRIREKLREYHVPLFTKPDAHDLVDYIAQWVSQKN